MAESIRQIPAKYGTAERVLHPRIGSMGRRLLACLPAVVLGLLCLAVLGVRRPAPMGIIVLVIVMAIFGGFGNMFGGGSGVVGDGATAERGTGGGVGHLWPHAFAVRRPTAQHGECSGPSGARKINRA